MSVVPSPAPPVSRRRLLIGATALAALGTAGVGCGSSEPPAELADLTTALDRARADSRLAAGAAQHTRGLTGQALEAVATERSAHAEALSDEIARLTGRPAPSTDAAATTPPTSSANGPEPTVDDVVAALRTSADRSATSASRLTGYRAGLLGSISAACTAAFTVALAPPEQPS